MKGDRIIVKTDRDFSFYVTVDTESTCRSCGAPILWCVTVKGKKMPVDLPDNNEPTTSHFATCPDAATWRKS
jgi:hypothetical protein